MENPKGVAITVNVRAIMCNGTTDSGEDEVYFIVAGKRPEGEIQGRIPNSGHYSVNDSGGNSKQLIENINLWSGILEPGEIVELEMIAMEEDDSPNPDALKFATNAIAKSIDTQDLTSEQ